MALAFALLFAATIMQGSYPILMKKYDPFSWEAFWLVYNVALVIIVFIYAGFCIPNFMDYVMDDAVRPQVITTFVLGIFQGVASIALAQAIVRIGASMTWGINQGVSLLVGSIAPMFILGRFPDSTALPVLIIGLIALMIAVFLLTKAGYMRDNAAEKSEATEDAAKKSGSGFVLALFLAVLAGMGGAAINMCLSMNDAIVQLAVGDGVDAASATCLTWVILFSGSFIPNLLFAGQKLIKNKTFGDFTAPGCGMAWFKSIACVSIALCGMFIYGRITYMLGDLGPVVGWIIFNGVSMIVNNIWSYRDHEWDGNPAAKKVSLIGNVAVVIAVVVVGIANGL